MSFDPKQLRKEYDKMIQTVQKGGIRREANKRFSGDKERREQAGSGDHKRTMPTFLRPEDIQKGIDYSFDKVYLTTVGKGDLRVLTKDDLIAFKKNIDLLQDQYKKGITAKQIINLSLQVDIDRANKQIHLAVPQSIKNGVVHFMTNASKESADHYHYVDVEFLAYKSISLRPSQVTRADIRTALSLGKIKFQCDCGRHTYWYRYMASIGGYGYGRIEEGFPKIRNPNLAGIACKHVLRVMNLILSPSFTNYLLKAMTKDRNTQIGQRQNVTARQLTKDLKEQIDLSEQGKVKEIKRNHNARNRELQRQIDNLARKHQANTEKAYRAQYKLDQNEAKQKAKLDAMNKLDAFLRAGVISQSEYDLFKKGAK